MKMFGNLQTQKTAASPVWATGFYQSTGVIGDLKSVNSPGGGSTGKVGVVDALSVIVPNSGLGSDLTSFSVIVSATATANGVFLVNLLMSSPPLPAADNQPGPVVSFPGGLGLFSGFSQGGPQPLPPQICSASLNASSGNTLIVEADISVSGGVLSGTFTASVNGSQQASGSLVALPSGSGKSPIATYVQLGSSPSGATPAVSGVTLAVSTLNFGGNVQTLNL